MAILRLGGAAAGRRRPVALTWRGVRREPSRGLFGRGVKQPLDGLIASRQAIRGVTGSYLLGPDHDARRPLHISVVDHDTFRLLQALPVQ